MPDKQNDFKKEQQNNVKMEMAKKGLKTAANAAFGPLGGRAVDLASKTKTGQNLLNKASNLTNNGLPLKPNPFQKQGMQSDQNINQGATGSNQSTTSSNQTEMEDHNMNEEEQRSKSSGLFGGMFGKNNLMNLFNPNSKKENSNLESKKVIGFIKRNWKLLLVALGSLIGIFMVMLIIVTVVMQLAAPIFYINQLVTNIQSRVSESVSDFFENMSNIARCGYMSDKECEQKLENDFYTALEEVYKKYDEKYNVQLNMSYLSATLTYYNAENILDDESFELDNDDNVLDDNQTSSYINFKKSKKKINLLAKKMISSKVITYQTTDAFGNTVTATKIVYYLDLDKYKKYLEEEFVRKFYFNGRNDDETKLKVKHAIEDIYSRIDFYEYVIGQRKSYTKVYAYCPGVVVPVDGETKTVPLEEYVSGVVAAEMGDTFELEALKAQAIAARSYVLARTNNCSEMAGNDTSFQVYNPNKITDKISQAIKETEGLILTYQDTVFASQYDSFCYEDSDCPDAKKNSDGSYTVTYTKEPMFDLHSITLNDSSFYGWITHGQGHGYGMSQLVAGQMAKQGSTYDEILYYFYSDGTKISNMVTTISGLYTTATNIPTSVAELRERADYYKTIGKVFMGGQQIDLSVIYDETNTYMGECVWYARSRMLELIYFSNMPDEQKANTFIAIASSRGNGWEWYDNISILDQFIKSSNYAEPHVGSFVSWSGGNTKCDPACGHVAVVEAVDFEKGTVTISEGWNKTGIRNWGNVGYTTGTYTFEELKNKKRSGDDQYTGMNGYVYILG